MAFRKKISNKKYGKKFVRSRKTKAKNFRIMKRGGIRL